ncbi:hypothetical protein IJ380_02120 [Candidatus Saccharibacteria bacterium]|nr:hypothetical protein [Candidatus Saccharibacteria bacterium]
MKNKVKNFILNNKTIAILALSAILTADLVYFFGQLWTQNYILLGIVWLGVFYVIKACLASFNKRRMKFSLLFSIPLATTTLLGSKIQYPEGNIASFGLLDSIQLIALACFFFSAFVAFLGFVDKNSFSQTGNPARLKKHNWLILSAIIFVCWVPLFLSYFPGGVSVDSAVEIRQAIGESELSNWHPVLHVLFLAIIINPIRWLTGSLTAGIALSVIIQMLIFATILGYAVRWVILETNNKKIGCFLLLFYALCPIVACYSITIWKDILFSGIFLLLFIKTYELTKTTRRKILSFKDIIPVVVLSILIAFLRNGGVLIVLIIGITLAAYFKKSRKLVAGLFGACIIFVILIQGPLYNAAGIISSPFMESMSVPAQQIAYTIKNGNLTEAEYKSISELADPEMLAEKYEPINGDPVKNVFYLTNAVQERKIEFIKLWFSILWHNVGSFLKAYILHTYSYWYIQGPSWAIDLSHVHDDIWMQADFNDYKLLGDFGFRLTQAIEIGNSRAIWGSWMANVGIMYWWVIMSVTVFLYEKKYKLLIPFSGVLIYMILLLGASPISWIFRYVFSLLLILPVATIIYFVKPAERKKHD